MTEKEQTHFGYETINSEEKEGRVADVFDSVATKYDLMNDVMSAGIHRMWKNWYIWQTEVKPGEHVLDLAAGTGDITLRLAKRMRGKEGDIEGRLVSSDINASMLKIGEERLTNKGWLKNLEFVIANVEALPFPDNSFDLITLPKMGELIARDRDSYQYLAESIRMHPPQEELKAMFAAAGLENCEYQNLSNGIVAIHKGKKPHA